VERSTEFLIRNGPAVLFLLVLAEQLGAPIPALPALLAAGAVARVEGLDPSGGLIAALAACLLADSTWYAIGRRGGGKVMSFLCRISLEPDSCVRRTEDLFSRHGARSLLVAKFVPGLSTAAPPLAGAFRMPFPKFLAFDFAGSLLWAAGAILTGYVFSEQLEEIASAIASMGSFAGIAAGALALYVLLKWLNRRAFLRALRIARIRPEELKEKLDAAEELVIVDLRSSLDFESEPETIPGALRIDREDLVRQHERIPRNRDVILFCT
jgi:membrane protein DedA with SNARE-associated domain